MAKLSIFKASYADGAIRMDIDSIYHFSKLEHTILKFSSGTYHIVHNQFF